MGLTEGEAHVIRSAGGVATDNAIRSIVVSQRLLGTREIILIHHTDCGMLTFSDDGVKERIRPRGLDVGHGHRSLWAMGEGSSPPSAPHRPEDRPGSRRADGRVRVPSRASGERLAHRVRSIGDAPRCATSTCACSGQQGLSRHAVHIVAAFVSGG